MEGFILEFINCRDALRRLQIQNNLIISLSSPDYAAKALQFITSTREIQEEACAFINIFFVDIFNHPKLKTLDDGLLILIKSTLPSNNTMTTKNAIHLLKRILMMVEEQPLQFEMLGEWKWLMPKQDWTLYFMFLDTVQDSYPHLIEPLLHKLDSFFIDANSSILSWWIIILKRVNLIDLTTREFSINPLKSAK
jgi:hypothetical protein